MNQRDRWQQPNCSTLTTSPARPGSSLPICQRTERDRIVGANGPDSPRMFGFGSDAEARIRAALDRQRAADRKRSV